MKNFDFIRCPIGLLIVFCAVIGSLAGQSVGINTAVPDPSAALDVYSKSQGFLPPRMSRTERDAIFAPANGLIIYNTTDNCVDVYMPSGWQHAYCNCPTPPPAQITPSSASISINANFSPQAPSGPGLSYLWLAPGATPASSSAQQPSFTYSSSGTYTITLIVSDLSGCSDSSSIQVTVNQCPTLPIGQSQTFNYTGSVQTFVVPACVTSIHADVRGAQGGAGSSGSGTGGLGGRAQANINVTPGETLYVYVGGQGGAPTGGWNGGGQGVGTGSGGGGASDIRRGGQSLNDRIIVAGGGGGGAQGNGGAGGGATGGQGSTNGNGVWAQGGTQIAGGNGGMYNNGGCSPGAAYASNGTFGIGGNGASNSSCCCYGTGGGGGWYGGGGMQINGAGGGSGYISTTGTSGGSMASGYQSGNGQIIISW